MRRATPILAPDWVHQFAAALGKQGLSALTRRTYVYDTVQFALWLDQLQTGFGAITSTDLVSYRHHLIRLRLKPATINHRLQAVRQLCRWAESVGRLPDLSGSLQHVPPVPRRRPPSLTEPQVHKLLRAAGQGRVLQRLRDYAIVQLMLQAGLRVGEVVSLRLDDLVLHARSGSVRVHLGKGGKEREVPLNASARRALNAYLATRGDAAPEAALFLSQQNSALSQRAVQDLLATLSRRASIEPAATPHRLRHTFAISYLRDHPGQLVELANLLGHDSLDTTAIYTQPSAEELAANLETSRLNVY